MIGVLRICVQYICILIPCQQVMSLSATMMCEKSEVSALFAVEKFGGENYHAWRARMRMALTGAGMWSIVSGVERRPGVVDAGAGVDEAVAAAEGRTGKKTEETVAAARAWLPR